MERQAAGGAVTRAERGGADTSSPPSPVSEAGAFFKTTAAPFRPPLAFRVGVTGAMTLDPEMRADIVIAVSDVLDEISRICGDVAATDAARAVYAKSGPDTGAVVVAREILSPLARGSDQLVAEAALARGYRLSVPTPFPLHEYENDFGGELQAFRDLLLRADGRVLEIDGSRDDGDAWRSYEAVGRMVVRNCDLLIAIWDDAVPPKGPGGTRDTLHFALRCGVPVWWIHPRGTRRPALVRRADELERPRSEGACFALGALIAAQLTPPALPTAEARSVLQGLRVAVSGVAIAIGAKAERHDDPLRRFLTDGEPPPLRLWKAHAVVMRLLTRPPDAPAIVYTQPAGYWGQAYTAPDRLSTAYAARYRSTYVYVIVLAALALVVAAVASIFDAGRLPGLVEALGVVEIAFLVALFVGINAAQRGRWHERWIGCRLLAELCRKQSALALLGWSLPIVDASSATASEGQESAWVSWYYGALARAAPLAAGALSGDRLAVIRKEINDLIILDQIDYHRRRAAENRQAAMKLLRVGEGCFLLTLAVVLWKLVATFRGHAITTPTFIAAILSVVTASILTLRSYAELDVIAHQSSRTAAHLEDVRVRIEAAATTKALASQTLGYDLSRGIAAMMSDVTGWAQLFRMKGIEAG